MKIQHIWANKWVVIGLLVLVFVITVALVLLAYFMGRKYDKEDFDEPIVYKWVTKDDSYKTSPPTIKYINEVTKSINDIIENNDIVTKLPIISISNSNTQNPTANYLSLLSPGSGSDKYYQFLNPAPNTTNIGFTICMWIKLNTLTLNSEPIFEIYTENSIDYFYIKRLPNNVGGDSGKIIAGYTKLKDYIETAKITDTNWHHIAFTHENTEDPIFGGVGVSNKYKLSIYLDGNLQESSKYSRTNDNLIAINDKTSINIAKKSYIINDLYDGKTNNYVAYSSFVISDIQMYNNTLNNIEIQNIYHTSNSDKRIITWEVDGNNFISKPFPSLTPIYYKNNVAQNALESIDNSVNLIQTLTDKTRLQFLPNLYNKNILYNVPQKLGIHIAFKFISSQPGSNNDDVILEIYNGDKYYFHISRIINADGTLSICTGFNDRLVYTTTQISTNINSDSDVLHNIYILYDTTNTKNNLLSLKYDNNQLVSGDFIKSASTLRIDNNTSLNIGYSKRRNAYTALKIESFTLANDVISPILPTTTTTTTMTTTTTTRPTTSTTTTTRPTTSTTTTTRPTTSTTTTTRPTTEPSTTEPISTRATNVYGPTTSAATLPNTSTTTSITMPSIPTTTQESTTTTTAPTTTTTEATTTTTEATTTTTEATTTTTPNNAGSSRDVQP